MSDRVLIMNHGVVVESGTPRECSNARATEFAARFLGAANIWAGEMRDGAFRFANGRAVKLPGAANGRPPPCCAPARWPLATNRAGRPSSPAAPISRDQSNSLRLRRVAVQAVVPSWSVETDLVAGARCHFTSPPGLRLNRPPTPPARVEDAEA